MAQAQYFATRGWHYLLVNHRGGTGFGRAYQDQLNGQWGVVDVQDARSGAEHLIRQGLADPGRVVITGGSAGGYTTLMALAQQPDFWAAGVSLYGIGDMYELKQGSHRFELNYEQGLIGRLPEAGRLWKERSPLTHVRNVRAPVLLFHGKDDKAVPYQQSVDFAEAARRNGVPVELVLYDDEGHGFNKEATRRDCLERTERFLEKYIVNQQG
jgi:dipeptidyl aminopeptidase/acylaminoacyl peptidase